jgi:hypothetical protein
LSVTTANCQDPDGLENGSSSIAYTLTAANGSKLNGTAISTVSNYRINETGYFDFTLNGSAALTLQTSRAASVTGTPTQTSSSKTIVSTPTVGTTSRDNVNARTFTYVSGSTTDVETTNYTVNPVNTTQITTADTYSITFNDLSYSYGSDIFKLTGTINGTDSYTSNGTTGSIFTYAGQVNVYRNNVLVGFLKQYATGVNTGELYMNINGVITPLFP